MSILVNSGLIVFYRCIKKNSYMESNYKKHASVYTMLSTNLKFDMCIVVWCSSFYINFGVSSIDSFFFYRIHKISYIMSYRLKLFVSF